MNLENLNEDANLMELDNTVPPSNEERLIKSKNDIGKYIEKQATALDNIMALNEQLECQSMTEEETNRALELRMQWQEKLKALKENLRNLQDYRDSIEVEIAQAAKEKSRQQQDRDKELKNHQNDVQANERRFQSLLKLTPSSLKLADASKAEEFIKDFVQFLENHLTTEADRKTHVIPLLQYLIRDVQGHAVFVKKLKDPKSEYWNLVTLKTLFLDHYSGQSWHASQCAQLANIAMGYEKPSDYIGRITQQTSQLGIRLDEQLDIGMGRIVKGWFYQLPHNVQQSVAADMNQIFESGSIQDYIDCIARHVPQQPNRVEGCPLYCPYCPKKVEYSCSCHTVNRIQGRSKGKAKREAELPVTPKEIKTKGDGKEFKKQRHDHAANEKLKTEGKCFKCKESNWTPQHRCKGVSAVFAKVDIPEVLGEFEREEINYNDQFCVSTAVQHAIRAASKRPTVILGLNGKECRDLFVDTMSDVTLISLKLFKMIDPHQELTLKKNNLPPLVSASNELLLLEGSAEIPVTRGQVNFNHQFIVSANLPRGIECLLGNDILGLIGVNLEGLSGAVVASVIEAPDLGQGQDLGKCLADSISSLVISDKDTLNYYDEIFTFRLRLKEEIEDLLSLNAKLSGFCTHPKAQIYFNTNDEVPVGARQYDLPYAHRKVVDEQVAVWLREGIIEECTDMNHSNNPLLVVPKWDITGKIKGWRTCIDPRLINVKILDSTYPLPKAREIFDACAGSIIWTVIDLHSGFNQIVVFKPHRKKTAFTWNKRIYQFVGAPFGFKNIPQDFQRLMELVFNDMDFVIPYLDDLIISSSSYADHVRHVTMVIQKLNEFNLRISVRKLKLAYSEIIVIGNKVSKDGVTVAIEKLDKMEHWKGNPVRTLKQLQQRLGFMNYFREYVPMYSRLMAPLERLRSEGNQICWKPEHDAIVDKFEMILRKQIMISYPDFTKQLVVSTDASKYGLGAVLYQVDAEEGSTLEVQKLLDLPKKFIRLASRSLTPSECNYGAPQRELLGVLFALKSFRPYLFGHQFRLLTDHKSLTYMLERPKVSSVIFNWLDEILQFNFKMEHVPGILNILPDTLSRIYDFDDRIEVPRVVLSLELTCDMDDLEIVNDGEVREKLLRRAHEHGHFGASDMARTIRDSTRSTWPNLVKDCQKIVSSCIPCQRYNIGRMGYHPPRNVQALLPFDHIAIDLKQMPLSSKGNMYYLLVVDVATRFVFLRPLASKTTYAVAQPLLRLFCDLGFPKVLQSDNGGEFVNDVMAALKKLAGIDHRVISAYHHRSNGIAERAIQSTSNAIYKAVSGQVEQWDDYLPAIQHAFNTRCIELHGSSPYSLLFGRAPNNFADYRDTDLALEKKEDRENRLLFLNSIVFPAIKEKVSKTHAKRLEYFEKTHRMLKSDFPVGSQVMVRDEMKSAKHQPTFEGPFTVQRRKASGNYEIKGLDGKTYIRSPWVLKLVAPQIIESLNVPDTIFAAVDKIIDHRETPGGGTQYRVRWEKAGPEMDTWLFKEDFVDYGPLQTYAKKLGVDLRSKNDSVDKTKNLKHMKKKKITFLETEDAGLGVAQSLKQNQEKCGPEGVPVDLSLSMEQKNALGAYWQRTKSVKRDRKQPIIESDSE